MKLIPLGARILIEPIAEPDSNVSPSGLVLRPETAKPAPQTGVVKLLGDGVKMPIEVGQTIWFGRGSAYHFDPRDTDGEALVNEDSVIAIVED